MTSRAPIDLTDTRRNGSQSHGYVMMGCVFVFILIINAHVMKIDDKRPGADLREVIALVDKDRDGRINFDEFLDVMSSHLGKLDQSKYVDIAFPILDKDKDGAIGVSDLRDVYADMAKDLNVNEEELIDILNHYSAGKGRLSKNDFAAWMGSV